MSELSEPQAVGVFRFAGYDAIRFVKSGGVIYPLTPCCQASAKGCEDCVACRKCYEEVPAEFGMAWTTAEWRGRP